MWVVRKWWALVVGVLLIGAGVIVENLTETTFAGIGDGEALVGTPSTSGFDISLLLLNSRPADVLVALGIILISGWVGYRIGRRRTRSVD